MRQQQSKWLPSIKTLHGVQKLLCVGSRPRYKSHLQLGRHAPNTTPPLVHKTKYYDIKSSPFSDLSKIPPEGSDWLKRTRQTTQDRWGANKKLNLHRVGMTAPSVMFPCSFQGRCVSGGMVLRVHTGSALIWTTTGKCV